MLNISSFPWAECSITENRVLYQSDSLSLKRSKRNTGVHRYEFELITIDMDLTLARGIIAKLSRAVDDTLLYIHPRLSYSQGIEPPSGIAAIGSSNVAGVDTLSVADYSEMWSLKAGDYIQLANDTKVYQVAEDVPYSMGTQQVKLTSPLRKTAPDETKLIMNDVAWYLTSNGSIETGSMVANENQNMQLTLIAVEKL